MRYWSGRSVPAGVVPGAGSPDRRSLGNSAGFDEGVVPIARAPFSALPAPTRSLRGRGARRARILSTLLFSDVVGANRAGSRDGGWRDVLDSHDGMVRRTLEIFDGHELKATGDGLVATFDLPIDAVRCALRIRDTAKTLGIHLRTAVHTGEIELRASDVCGAAVHLCRRLLDVASPDEVVVTRTVVELLAGTELGFEPRGKTRLRDVPGTWRLFTATEEPAGAGRNPSPSSGAYRTRPRVRRRPRGRR